MSILHEILAPKQNADEILLVSNVFFKNKDKIYQNDELIELDTSKTAIIIDSPFDGYVEYLVEKGSSVNIGEIILRIHDVPDFIGNKKPLKNKISSKSESLHSQIISKKAQDYINKHKIDISRIKKKFIQLQDIKNLISTDNIETKQSPDKSFSKSMLASFESDIELRKKPLILSKKIEIQALSNIQSTGMVSTIFYNIDDCDFPKSENLILNSSGSILAIITFEVSKLLRKYPMLNAYYDNDFIMEYVDINVGIALDIEDGLKVYTLRKSDTQELKRIEYEISQGIYHYMRKNLTTDQITGSTFTITDLSSLGVDRFVPLINYKQSAVLGISSFDNKLKRFTLSLSFDHRVTEGKVASKFLSELSTVLKKYNNKLT